MQEQGDRYGGGGGGSDRYGGGRGGGDAGRGGSSDRYGSGDRYGSSNGGGTGGDRYGAGNDRYGGGGGYGANKYGGQGGYGGGGNSDRYGMGASSGPRGAGSNRYGAGGGGGRYGEQDDEGDRDALFGGAKDRYAQRKADGPPPPYSEDKAGGSGGGSYGASYGDAGYGGSGGGGGNEGRELTAEEQEEEEVRAVKDQIRNIKREDVSSTRNALRIAQMAEESGRDTLARLGQQGEHIHNTEKNLDLAHNQNRLAEERARELKKLNKSMFAVHVSNPFASGARARQREQDILDKHLDEKDRREATRAAAFQSEARMQKAFREIDEAGGRASAGQQRSLAERAKYQFEADSEDEEMENEIDSNLDALHGAAGRLHQLAKATGAEVDQQIKHLDRIAEKVCSRSCFPCWDMC